MKHINQVLQNNKEPTHSEPCKSLRWSQETEKLALGLFARLADLFGQKCKVQGLAIYDQDGKYSQAFRVWCIKLDEAGIVVSEVAEGIKRLEMRIRDSVRTGDEIWPPSYAEFIGYCRHQKKYGFVQAPMTKLTCQQNKERMRLMRERLGL